MIKNLGPITLDHKEIYDSYFNKYAPEICEHTFASLYIWRHANPVMAVEIDESLIILLESQNKIFIYGTPLGHISITDAFRDTSTLLDKPLTAIGLLTDKAVATLCDGHWQIAEDRNNFDYIYLQRDIAKLEGRKYHRKRNLINQCLGAHNCLYEEIAGSNIEEVRDMLKRWKKAHRHNTHPDLHYEHLALNDLFDNYEALNVMGGAIRVDGNIEAFSIADRLNDNTAVVHFEKATTEIKGLYQLINKWFAENPLSNFEFINREEDSGIEGLIKAKQSYYPIRLQKKYQAYPL
ncbi:MAG: phosphatidylglycerol lysyltransferase domain-containing protein [Pseudomonadota bacterium]